MDLDLDMDSADTADDMADGEEDMEEEVEEAIMVAVDMAIKEDMVANKAEDTDTVEADNPQPAQHAAPTRRNETEECGNPYDGEGRTHHSSIHYFSQHVVLRERAQTVPIMYFGNFCATYL